MQEIAFTKEEIIKFENENLESLVDLCFAKPDPGEIIVSPQKDVRMISAKELLDFTVTKFNRHRPLKEVYKEVEKIMKEKGFLKNSQWCHVVKKTKLNAWYVKYTPLAELIITGLVIKPIEFVELW